ncbi:MAG: DUF1284 domain-containing protein [Puniceicoccales bacterium]|jgi:hypothetical protein|nr:DUF1284 domain-containing protein [Puniceicoccales bacterium]
MCLQSFQGKGYSSAFIAAVKKILSVLNNNYHGKIISITHQCDDVCKHCPKRVNHQCEEEQEIMKLDAYFAKIFQLYAGDVTSMFEIQKATKKQLCPKEFGKICGNCRWFKICNKHWNSISPARMDE